MALGVPGRLRPRILSTFGTTRVVDRQPFTSAAFIPEEIPGTHFQRLSRPQDTWFCRKEPRKKSQVTPPVIDPGTVRLVAQRLNHYATPVPLYGHLRTKVLPNRTRQSHRIEHTEVQPQTSIQQKHLCQTHLVVALSLHRIRGKAPRLGRVIFGLLTFLWLRQTRILLLDYFKWNIGWKVGIPRILR